MPYIRLIKPSMQELAETVASVLGVEVIIADKNLTRIAGTGEFITKLDENCAEDSIFADVINIGEPIVNLSRDQHCVGCSHVDDCPETANMAYPIKSDGNVYGVVSFASFDLEQRNIMKLKNSEYFKMLKEVSTSIEKEIANIKITNKLKANNVEVGEIINCLNKGIIITSSNHEVMHINSKALEILGINISHQKIIEADIHDFIKNIDFEITDDEDFIGQWQVAGKDIRVIYNINKIYMNSDQCSLMISFDVIADIVNKAKTYGSKGEIKFSNIVGSSSLLLSAIKKSKIAATTDSTILLMGDSGTGKELFARSIHNESQRRNGPFVAINCASIPENLIESELFGYEKGAFTGASLNGKKGKIELANNGTLFLDEIGDLPLYMQTKLLRVLQERTIDKIGGEKPIDVNIRVISATNKDLKKMVDEGDFRLDLYYRLNVIPINLPRLGERQEDIFTFSELIIESLAEKMGKEPKELSDQVKDFFKTYTWPGNVRELENVMEHAMCFCESNYIEMVDLPDYLQEGLKEQKISLSIKGLQDDFDLVVETANLEEMKNMLEKTVIDSLIDEYGDTVDGKKKVAARLGIGLTTLYRKMGKC